MSFIFIFLYLTCGTPIALLTLSEPTGAGAFFGLPMLAVSIMFAIWLGITALHPIEYNEPKQYIIKTVNNIDVIVVDKQIVNLNKITERDWEEDEVIYIWEPKTTYAGISYAGTTFLKNRIEPAIRIE
jgi:hypothetical protein